MKSDSDSLIKVREIAFSALHADKNQAGTAIQLLQDCDGVDKVERLSDTRLRVSYNIRNATLEAIEGLLQDFGFHLDNALVYRMRRALVSYMEQTQRSNMGCDQGESNCTTRVFINRYQQRRHGCQDDRPQHWRRYL